MKIFVISLLSAIERRKSIQKQFEKQGIDFEFMDAVNGRQLSESELAEVCDLDAIEAKKRWLTKGAIGCALSHYRVYKEIVQRDLKYALVLEDDICLQKEFNEIMQLLPNHIQGNEIILLYYLSWEPLQLKTQTKQAIKGIHALYKPAHIQQPMTAAAYMITNEACKSMINTFLPINCAADEWGKFYERGGFEKIRCVYPRIIETLDYKSTIDYVQAEGFLGKLLSLVNKYKIFPFYQAAEFRRRRMKNKVKKVIVR